MVCKGNICRSPMAEFALRREIEREGLQDRVAVDSAGVSDEEIGNPIDSRARTVLEREGLDPSQHRAQQITPDWFADHDLILAMEDWHAEELAEMAPAQDTRGEIRMLRSFDPEAADLSAAEQGVADPWYGGADGFETTWSMIRAAVPGILDRARRDLERGSERDGA